MNRMPGDVCRGRRRKSHDFRYDFRDDVRYEALSFRQASIVGRRIERESPGIA